jgi:hypothetical protein
MTALTANFNRTEKVGRLQSYPIFAGAKVYKNALLMVRPDGYVAPAAALAGAVYVGMAYEEALIPTASGDVSLRVERKNAIEIAIGAATQADLGKEVYASDDNTVSTTQGANEVAVGVIIEVISATKVLVAQNTSVAK